MSDEQGELYPKKRPWELEPHYSRHVGAMTTEGLHSKHDIAIQLAWRDAELARLKSALTTAESQLQAQRERAERAEAELGAATRSMLLATAQRVSAEKRLAELQGELERVAALFERRAKESDKQASVASEANDPFTEAHCDGMSMAYDIAMKYLRRMVAHPAPSSPAEQSCPSCNGRRGKWVNNEGPKHTPGEPGTEPVWQPCSDCAPGGVFAPAEQSAPGEYEQCEYEPEEQGRCVLPAGHAGHHSRTGRKPDATGGA